VGSAVEFVLEGEGSVCKAGLSSAAMRCAPGADVQLSPAGRSVSPTVDSRYNAVYMLKTSVD
jgi:hypothetical protein